jgi:hypothetical protein
MKSILLAALALLFSSSSSVDAMKKPLPLPTVLKTTMVATPDCLQFFKKVATAKNPPGGNVGDTGVAHCQLWDNKGPVGWLSGECKVVSLPPKGLLGQNPNWFCSFQAELGAPWSGDKLVSLGSGTYGPLPYPKQAIPLTGGTGKYQRAEGVTWYSMHDSKTFPTNGTVDFTWTFHLDK